MGVLKVNQSVRKISYVEESDEAVEEAGEVARLPLEDPVSLSMSVGGKETDKGIAPREGRVTRGKCSAKEVVVDSECADRCQI